MKELVFEQFTENMEKTIKAFEKSLQKVRTGRASLALLDGIKVDFYGQPTPLNQVANLSVPESRQILISPWDTSVIGAVEKAIQRSDLGLNPMNDGKIIRISIPPLTEARRKELVKIVKKMAEECKVNIRNCRRDANEELKSLKKDGDLSEDDLRQAQDEVQKMTDKNVEKVDQILELKEKEIMEI
ncbi:MAG: ribosome recycling factor [Smithellaceae bacterium]|nr:ribosome recycling factor [Smithellaceae bacterium]